MHYFRMLLCKFQLSWPSTASSFLNDPTPFLHFCDHLPLWRGPGPLFEQTWIPFIQGWFVVWLNLSQCFWRRLRFFKKFSIFFTLSLLSPLKDGWPPSFEQTWSYSLSPKDDLCQVWLKLAQWFWRKSRKCKSLQTDRMTTDNRRSE
jgi:hypothetical protein